MSCLAKVAYTLDFSKHNSNRQGHWFNLQIADHPLVIWVFIIAILLGWVAIGLEVGKRLGEMLKWELHPAAEAGIGTFLFSAVVLGIGFIPCIGWIAPFVIGLLAFGGVIISRFGRMTYRFQSTSTAVVETPEPVEEKPKKRTRKAADKE